MQNNKDGKKKKNGVIIALWIILGSLLVAIIAFLGCREMNGRKASDAAQSLLDMITGDAVKTETVDIDFADQAGEEYHVEDESNDEALLTDDLYRQPDAPVYTDEELDELISSIANKTDGNGVIGIIRIPSQDIKLPVIGGWSDALLKVSVCRYQGNNVNQPGHMVIIGHNYKNGAHFGKLKNLKVGDEVFLSDVQGFEKRYVVYETEVVKPNDFSALEKFRGECGLSLMTCYQDGTNRLFVRCEQVDK